MATDNKYNITSFELDQLKEVVNMGASRAGDVLSKMVGRKVVLTVPEADIEDIKKSIGYFKPNDNIVTAVKANISGDAGGILLFIFPEKSAHIVARLVTHENNETTKLSDIAKSALREVGNILAGAYLTALANFLKLSILHNVSKVTVGKLDKILSDIIKEIGQSSDITLIFRVSLIIDGESTETELYLLADPKFTNRILERTKQMFGV